MARVLCIPIGRRHGDRLVVCTLLVVVTRGARWSRRLVLLASLFYAAASVICVARSAEAVARSGLRSS